MIFNLKQFDRHVTCKSENKIDDAKYNRIWVHTILLYYVYRRFSLIIKLGPRNVQL